MALSTSMFKRVLSTIMVLAILMVSSNLTWLTVGNAASSVTETITDGGLVAKNYAGISSGEQAILKSEYVKGTAHTYAVPGDADGLISVDPDAKKITVLPFSDGDYVWNPSAATLVYSGGEESVELNEGTGSFEYDGSEYTVRVTYDLYISVDADLQRVLLNGPYYLVRGINNIEDFAGEDAMFETLAENIDALYRFVEGFQPTGTYTMRLIGDEADAIARLYQQTQNNSAAGGRFDISALIDAYVDAAEGTSTSGVEYLLTHGAEFKSAAQSTYADITILVEGRDKTETGQFGWCIERIKEQEPTMGDKIDVFFRALRNFSRKLQDAAEDEWAILDAANNPLRDSMSTSDYIAVDGLISRASSADYHDNEIRAKLLASSVTLVSNVNRHNVTIVLKAGRIAETTVDSTELTMLTEFSDTIQLPNGSSSADVRAAVTENGIEAASLDAWGSIDSEHYSRTESALPDELTADITYTIEYSPKTYSVTYNFDAGLPSTVPYGYNMTLPVHDGDELVYDYEVNGEAKLQGEVVRISDATTITRTEGRPWDIKRLGQLVALNYDELSDDEKSVLNSIALNTKIVRFREPSNDDDLVAVELVDVGQKSYKVTAEDFASGIPGIGWKATSGHTVGGSVQVDFQFNSGVAEFVSEAFESVEVVYDITLTNLTSAEILEALNLPGQLAREAADQKDSMSILDGQYDNLSQFDHSILNKIEVGIKGSEMSEENKKAFTNMKATCFDKDADELYVFSYLKEYRANGLTYYYQDNHYAMIRNQINILRDTFLNIYNDPEFYNLLVTVEAEEYYDRFDEIIEKLNSITLTDPNEAIDVTSPSLPQLVSYLEALIANPKTYTDADKPIVLSKPLTAAAPQRAVVTVVVEVRNSLGTVTATSSAATTFSMTEALTDADISALNDMKAGLVTALEIDTAHYESSDAMPLATGQFVTANQTITFAFQPMKYTSEVFDENSDKVATLEFYFDKPTVTLPACAIQGFQYKYTVAGEEIIVGSEAKSYTFTTEQIDQGLYTPISRETVDVYREDLLELVELMNKAVGKAGMVSGRNLCISFIPVEDANGDINIVWRISPDGMDELKDALAGIAEELVGTNFSYIKLSGEIIRKDAEASLQGILNAILKSNLSLDTILGAITPAGIIVESEFPAGFDPMNTVLVDGHLNQAFGSYYNNDVDKLGAILVETTMQFGVSENDDGIVAPLYITLEDFGQSTSDLKDLRDAAKKVREYGNITLHDGMADVEFRLPEKAYQLYLAAMLVLGNASFEAIADVKFESVVDLVLALLDDITSDKDITTTTFENTAKKLDANISLGEYSSAYNTARDVIANILRNVTFQEEEFTSNSYKTLMNYDLTELLDDAGLQDSLRNVIMERNSGLNASVKVTITNTADYEALVIDLDESGTDILNFTRDLQADMAGLHKNAVVILLSDVTGNITFAKDGFLDLNGFVIDGALTCNGKVYIVDSRLATDSGAGVTGTVSGKAVISAGKYDQDVSALLKEGFTQENGLVSNGYYYVTDDGNGDVEIHFTPNYDVVANSTKETLEAVAADLIADIALNYFICASMKIGDFDIYAFDVEDAVDLYQNRTEPRINEVLDCIHCDQITGLANEILDAITDFSAIGEAMENGTPVLEYALEYSPWYFEVRRVAEGNYLTADILPNPNDVRTQNIAIYIDDDGTNAPIFKEIGEIVTVDAEVELEDIGYTFSDDKLGFTGNGSFNVTVDMTGNPDYAIAIGVVLANGTADTAKREALIAGINTYYESGYIMAELKDAVEVATTAELVAAFRTNDSFAAMRSNLGLESVVPDSVKELYDKYADAIKFGFDLIDAVGEFKGGSSEIGSYGTDYGTYIVSKTDKSYSGRANISGNYGVKGSAVITEATITVKLFTEDRSFKIKVTDKDGNELYLGDDLDEAFANAEDQSTVTVFADVSMNNDYQLDGSMKIERGDFIDFNGKFIILGGEDASLTIDVKADEHIKSGDDRYYVVEGGDGVTYTYTLAIYPVIVTDAEGTIVYAGDSLDDGLALTDGGYTVTVNAPVVLGADFEFGFELIVSGGEDIDFNGHAFILTDEATKLTIDVQITDSVLPSGDEYVVEENQEGTLYVYTLYGYKVLVKDNDGNTVYAGDSLDDAFAAAEEDYTVTVLKDVQLDADFELDHAITLTGADMIDFNGHQIILSGEGSLTSDIQIAENISSASEYSYVTEAGDGPYVYSLTPYDPEINLGDIDKKDNIKGFKTDEADKLIILDVVDPGSISNPRLAGNGITVAQFKEQVAFVTVHASASEVKVIYNNRELADDALVPTGATVSVTATNPDSDVRVNVQYSVVILGDTNCDGAINSGDAKLMLDHYFGTATLTGLALIAADTNCNGGVDSGDAVKNAVKYTRPADYKSDLR